MNYFFSGWGVSKIKNCDDYIFLDSTKIVAEYKTVENIAQNFEKIFPQKIEILSAWSMGAIIVLGILEKIKAKKIILYSPTLKFAANDEILEQLNNLRQNIVKNKENAMKLFYRKCGISRELYDESYYMVEELLSGLDFLENTELNITQVPENTEFIVVCGENDKIISPDFSINIAEKLGAKLVLIPNGSHYDAVLW
ncbi:MAG: hypothetical protein FWF51_10815 [Chitinivibrionia bacterium]|nr:hypothetical protein [Chitinivibrionia bacterium]